MDSTPPTPDSPGRDTADARCDPRPARTDRGSPRNANPGPRWCVEMLESPLMDRGLAYAVSDGSPHARTAQGDGWIEFDLPTARYRNASGHKRVRIRLSVIGGRLTITAPDVYPAGSLRRTSDPPPDANGTVRIMRLGDDDLSQIDLFMASDGSITAALRMETIRCAFNRRDVVLIADDFAGGIDLLDFAVRKSGLLLPGRTGLDD